MRRGRGQRECVPEGTSGCMRGKDAALRGECQNSMCKGSGLYKGVKEINPIHGTCPTSKERHIIMHHPLKVLHYQSGVESSE